MSSNMSSSMAERTHISSEILSKIAQAAAPAPQTMAEIQSEAARLPPIPVPESAISTLEARERNLQEQHKALQEDRRQIKELVAAIKSLGSPAPAPAYAEPSGAAAPNVQAKLEYLDQQVRETQELIRRKEEEHKALRLRELISSEAQKHDYDLVNELGLHDQVMSVLHEQYAAGQKPNIESACELVCKEELTKVTKISKSRYLSKLAAAQPAEASADPEAVGYRSLNQHMAPVSKSEAELMATVEGRKRLAAQFLRNTAARTLSPSLPVQALSNTMSEHKPEVKQKPMPADPARELTSGFASAGKTAEQIEVEARKHAAAEFLRTQKRG